MGILSRKIAAFTKTIMALGARPQLNYPESNQWFDSSPEELRTALNGVVDDLLATTNGASGADNIGATKLSDGTGASTVQGELEYVLGQAQGAVLGQIPDGTITPTKLSFDPATQAELDTTNTAIAAEKGINLYLSARGIRRLA